jgi:1-acyl-sn-glycerol-3-phosphate acyltransferase
MSSTLEQIIPKSPIHSLGRWLFSIYCYVVFNSYLKLKITGKQNIPNEPFIICSNHQSHLDAIILGHIGAFFFSRSALIAAKDYWFDNRTRFFISRFFFNIIPINRKESVKEFNIMEVTRLMKTFLSRKGKCIVILPEGTRSTNGKIKEFKKGITSLSKAAGLPIVPVYIQNSGKYWPKGASFMRPGKLHIRIGKPIFPSDLTKVENAEIIRNSIISLSQNE